MSLDFESSSTNAIASAAIWLESTLLGTIATAVAVMAVASIGFLMLAGRIDVRRGAQVVLGCFVIFGASTIANGIFGASSGTVPNPDLAQAPLPPPPLLFPGPPANSKAAASPFDPYAGAALPQR